MNEGAKYQLPTSGPSAQASGQLDEWRGLVDNSLTQTQATAEKWRTGLAGFASLVTGVLIIKGPGTVAELAPGWSVVVPVALVLGALSSVVALWIALDAAAPLSVKFEDFSAVIEKWGSIRARNVAVAGRTARSIGWAKVWMGMSVGLLLFAVLVWWLAPQPNTSLSEVATSTGTYCGHIETSAKGSFTIRPVVGDVVKVSYADVKSISAASTCVP